MHADIRTAKDQPQRGLMTTLYRSWTAYTLRRAIGDVATMSDHDYQAFGLDKPEILQALRQLHDEVKRDRTHAVTDASYRSGGAQLAIVVTKRAGGLCQRAL